MEDVFWRRIDQWGADALQILRAPNASNDIALHKERLTAFVLSLIFRNPEKIAAYDALTRQHLRESQWAKDYDKHRRAHEPATFEGFQAALDQGGINELTAEFVRKLVYNPNIGGHLLSMSWHIVELTNGQKLLTSDRPVIQYNGLKDVNGLLMLPISPTRFLAIFNKGPIDMRDWIDTAIEEYHFIDGMNRHVVQHKIDCVYGEDDTQMDFIRRYWCVRTADA